MKNDKPGIVVVGAGGRMGQTIIRLLLNDYGLKLAGAVDLAQNLSRLSQLPCAVSDNLANLLPQCEEAVIVDFSSAASSVASAKFAAEHRLHLVIGSTGLDEAQKAQLHECARQAPILWSANMSIGINVLMRFLPLLARALGSEYDLEMTEIHHKRKKDAPSGTALMLGEALASARGWELGECRCSCRDGITGERPQRQIGIQAVRGGDVVGIHTCYFLGPGETIEVTHQAQSRENFAQGALRAASWLFTQPAGKLYSMQDVIANAEEGAG